MAGVRRAPHLPSGRLPHAARIMGGLGLDVPSANRRDGGRLPFVPSPCPAREGTEGGDSRAEGRLLRRELLVQDPLLQVVLRIEQQLHPALLRLADLHLAHVAYLEEVGGGADRTLAGL